MPDLSQLLSVYIHHIGEQTRWLPIVAWVYLLFELQSLKLFEKNIIIQNYHQLTKEQLIQRLLDARRKKLFLVFLSGLVSWTLFFDFFFGH